MALLLGIETSCDETAAAVVEDGREVLSNVIASQVDLHRRFGGVVPEIASRAHIERLDSVLADTLSQARVAFSELDAIAVTNGPGLIGALLMGLTAAKTLSWALGKPLLAVDHIFAHAYSPVMDMEDSPWPAVALIASGGHTTLFDVRGPLAMSCLGATTDDAAGEAFDKVATILGLPYPGGPSIERAARSGDPSAIRFPRTMLSEDSLDFSFSGIKTAVMYHVHGAGRTSGGLSRLSPREIADVAAGFQIAVVEVLVQKTMRAARCIGAETVLLGGGVAANKCLRAELEKACAERKLRFHAAKFEYCTDNAAMIAGLGYHHWLAGDATDLTADAYAASWARRR